VPVGIRWNAVLALALVACAAIALAVIGFLPALGESALPRRATLPQVARDSGEAPAPDPSPSPNPGGFTVRSTSDYSSEDSDSSTLHIVGEVLNSGPAAESVLVEVSFFSAGNVLLGGDFTVAAMRIVGSGADSPFEILSVDAPAFHHYELTVTEAVIPPANGAQPVSGLVVKNVVESMDDDGHLHFSGKVDNTSDAAYDFVEPIGALYDAAGNVIRVSTTFTSPTTVAPGATASFELVFRDPPPFTSKRFWVNAAP